MSVFPTIVRIAAHGLAARYRRTLVTIAGASVAMAIALCAISLIGGLRAAFTGRLLASGAHLTVTAADVGGRRSDLLLDVGPTTGAVDLGRTAARADRVRLRNVMTVLRAVERSLGDRLEAASPYLVTQVIASYGTNEEIVSLRGVLPDREDRLSRLDEALESGSVKRLAATRYGVLLGRRAARELGAGTGDRIRIVSMTGDILNLEVVGVFDLGIEAANRGGLVNLRLAQSIEQTLPSEATAIALQLRQPSEAASAARRIERAVGRRVETWEQTYPAALSPFLVLRAVLATIAVIALAIAGFAIASSLIASSHDERATMAALRASGLTRRALYASYLARGILLAAGGVVGGALLGAVGLALLSVTPTGAAGDLMSIEPAMIPVEWSPRWFALAGAGMLVAGLLGAIVPARGAARRDSGAVLRVDL